MNIFSRPDMLDLLYQDLMLRNGCTLDRDRGQRFSEDLYSNYIIFKYPDILGLNLEYFVKLIYDKLSSLSRYVDVQIGIDPDCGLDIITSSEEPQCLLYKVVLEISLHNGHEEHFVCTFKRDCESPNSQMILNIFSKQFLEEIEKRSLRVMKNLLESQFKAENPLNEDQNTWD